MHEQQTFYGIPCDGGTVECFDCGAQWPHRREHIWVLADLELPEPRVCARCNTEQSVT